MQGHAQDFRDRSADALMGRKTIPLLLSQPVARWSLAALITAWTIGLIALWQPPVVVGMTFAALGLRCLGGYLSSFEEKDDYMSYCWYGVSGVLCFRFDIQVLTVGLTVLASWKYFTPCLPSFER